jgi:hypothetical protein
MANTKSTPIVEYWDTKEAESMLFLRDWWQRGGDDGNGVNCYICEAKLAVLRTAALLRPTVHGRECLALAHLCERCFDAKDGDAILRRFHREAELMAEKDDATEH